MKVKQRIIVLLVFAISITFILSGCGNVKQQGTEENGKAKNTYDITKDELIDGINKDLSDAAYPLEFRQEKDDEDSYRLFFTDDDQGSFMPIWIDCNVADDKNLSSFIVDFPMHYFFEEDRESAQRIYDMAVFTLASSRHVLGSTERVDEESTKNYIWNWMDIQSLQDQQSIDVESLTEEQLEDYFYSKLSDGTSNFINSTSDTEDVQKIMCMIYVTPDMTDLAQDN